jgi:hypothetical protein
MSVRFRDQINKSCAASAMCRAYPRRGVHCRASGDQMEYIEMSDLMTAREAADYRRCSLRTLDRERADGSGPPYARIGARIYYRRADLDAYIIAHLLGGERDSAGTKAI